MAAHEKRLVHRDIKPANVMLVREVGEDDLTVKLIDFGLAKTLVEEGGSVVNVTGTGFLGTPLFASPEQCEEIALDIRSDIYSLGVTLWFVLAGRAPFSGGLGKVFAQHLHAPPPWDQLPAAMPKPVRALLARMLAKDRAERPQTPADLRRDIETCLRASGQLVSSGSMVIPFRVGIPPTPRRGGAPGGLAARRYYATGRRLVALRACGRFTSNIVPFVRCGQRHGAQFTSAGVWIVTAKTPASQVPRYSNEFSEPLLIGGTA